MKGGVRRRVARGCPAQLIQMWLTDDTWHLLQLCWSFDAGQRPAMGIVAARIKHIELEVHGSMTSTR